MTTLTESPSVIELSDGTDFKLNLIIIPAEMDSLPHHSGHVHPERDVPVHSESSRSIATTPEFAPKTERINFAVDHDFAVAIIHRKVTAKIHSEIDSLRLMMGGSAGVCAVAADN